MKRGLRGGNVVVDLLLVLSLCATTAAAVRYGRRVSDAQSVIDDLAVSANRARAQDRLVGRRIAFDVHPADSEVVTRGTARRTALWVLDAAKCVGCLSEITQWARLEQLADLSFEIVIVGEVTPSLAARLRTLTSTHVRSLGIDEAERLIGNALGSTKLLLDPDGVVLLADSRSSGQDCGWNFEAQLGALLGVLPSDEIRFTAGSSGPDDSVAEGHRPTPSGTMPAKRPEG